MCVRSLQAEFFCWPEVAREDKNQKEKLNGFSVKFMPKKKTVTRHGTLRTLKNVSYENQVTVWLMQDGWQVFRPVLDDGHSTDVLISDGPNYYRVQVKTVDASKEARYFENRWQDSNVDVVIVFARDSNWGYVMPAFTEYRRKLDAEGHHRFVSNKREFLRAFHKV